MRRFITPIAVSPLLAVCVAALAGCETPPAPAAAQPSSPHIAAHGEASSAHGHASAAHASETSPSAAHTSGADGGEASCVVEPTVALNIDRYAWHDDPAIDPLEATEALAARFPVPTGYRRVALPSKSFGAWLRALPLAAPKTPVRSFDGNILHTGDHANIAAVTTLDIGKQDLQQCADAVMRLHAEWLWTEGRATEASYPSGGGAIPWKRFLAGGYPALKGNSFEWKNRGRRKNNHSTYRQYLNQVFAWANTIALEKKTQHIDREQARPGDFFVLGGSPGHSVLILDIAEAEDGSRVALLGQSFMPAQSFQVLQPTRSTAWFRFEDQGVQTPFWPRFPWSSLRRIEKQAPANR